jgi:hypothetical protein
VSEYLHVTVHIKWDVSLFLVVSRRNKDAENISNMSMTIVFGDRMTDGQNL